MFARRRPKQGRAGSTLRLCRPAGRRKSTARLPLRLWRHTRPATSTITLRQSAPIARLPTEDITATGRQTLSDPVSVRQRLRSRRAILRQRQERCFRAGQLEAERLAVQGLQNLPRAVPGVPRRRIQPTEPPELRQPGQHQLEYWRQLGSAYRDVFQPDQHHRRTLLPVIREVRVLN